VTDLVRRHQAAHVRHLQVHQDQVELARAELAYALGAVVGDRDLAAQALQEAPRHFLVDDVVLYQQHGCTVLRCCRGLSWNNSLHCFAFLRHAHYAGCSLRHWLSQRGIRALDQLALAHRLGQARRHAQVRQHLQVFLAIHRGQHDDARLSETRFGTDATGEVHAVHRRHA
jgi:hypothetical protein